MIQANVRLKTLFQRQARMQGGVAHLPKKANMKKIKKKEGKKITKSRKLKKKITIKLFTNG